MNPVRTVVEVIATDRPKTDDVLLSCGHVKRVPRYLARVAENLRITCAQCSKGEVFR